MKKRNRFSRNCLASSRGAYVRQSHLLFIQEQLAERGIEASLREVTEIFTRTSIKRYYVKCFGEIKEITEREAMMIPDLVIIL